MKTPTVALAAGAAIVTIALTGAAFWLSYEHLHDVAAGNGLDGARAWAWPSTVDLFIVAGELLILRASLRGVVDWWAITLAAVGSLGSIALNVFGVGDGAEPLEYVVAAVPPSAALVAFGALMRQVHDALAAPPAPTTPVVIPPVLELVPAGARLLPIVAAGMAAEVTIERDDQELDEVVTRPAIEPGLDGLGWPMTEAGADRANARQMTTAARSDEHRQVVTVEVTLSPAELRKRARKFAREVASADGKPVTIDQLREKFGLSRREGTELWRQVAGGTRS